MVKHQINDVFREFISAAHYCFQVGINSFISDWLCFSIVALVNEAVHTLFLITGSIEALLEGEIIAYVRKKSIICMMSRRYFRSSAVP